MIKTRVSEITSLTGDIEASERLIGWVQFPDIPMGGPIEVEGVVWHPAMYRWIVPEPTPTPTHAPEAYIKLLVMNEDNAQVARKMMAVMQAGQAGGMRMGASGPVLDLNKLRRDS